MNRDTRLNLARYIHKDMIKFFGELSNKGKVYNLILFYDFDSNTLIKCDNELYRYFKSFRCLKEVYNKVFYDEQLIKTLDKELKSIEYI